MRHIRTFKRKFNFKTTEAAADVLFITLVCGGIFASVVSYLIMV
jgi:hypothetical protein